MKKFLIATAIATGFAASAFAQEGERMLCSEYSALDNAGQMAVVAAVESAVSEMDLSQELTSAEIHGGLVDNCTEHPDMIVVDVVKEYIVN
jgi:hypothetical protein